MAKRKAANSIKYLWSIIGKSFLLILLSFILFTPSIYAQENCYAYLITFKDKGDAPTYHLSSKTLTKRTAMGIAIDSNDFFVNKAYIQKICVDSSIHYRYSLKWLNAIVVDSYDSLLHKKAFPSFVRNVAWVGKTSYQAKVVSPQPAIVREENHQERPSIKELEPEDYGIAYIQNEQIKITKLHELGLDGTGIQVAVFDAGFYNSQLIPAFQYIKLISGYDLVDLDNKLINTDNHGTAVSSCIAGFDKGKYIGSGPGVDLVLFRTENSASEFPLEELNWCKAAELADSMGIDLISSSLGYTRYPSAELQYDKSQFDGKTSYVSKSASLLVDKGIFVVNSAGNEGSSSWINVGTPADVANVLTVGAVDQNNIIGSFSSRGYEQTGLIKPDICALGVRASVSSTYGSYYKGNGTSYATPIISGAVACLLQAFPTKSINEICTALRLTSDHNDQPDLTYGYGTANFYAAYLYLKFSEINFDVTPHVVDTAGQILLFTNDLSTVQYKVYERLPFLYIFSRKKKIRSGIQITNQKFTYLELDKIGLDCSKKYTVKLKLKNRVENWKLKYKQLSVCRT